ncbi:MAG: LLM class flavin-dependent oxidoreductase [Beijerinckiaceae bacterium]|jgi:N-acetyl-S-(2-succino)cysteine monooxygenase|nr:LLM class flavin-dependent oxidoreductase [Beijerinckiaceae bacterium]
MPGTQMKLGMFYWPGGGQHMAAWRHPDAHPDFDVNVQQIIDLAKVAERGLFDMLFMADSLSFWRGPLEAMSHDAAGSWIEPLTVMATIAQHTRHLGLVCTSTTTYDQPYLLARRFAGLDLASGGRAGWNLITSGNENVAHSFGHEHHVEKSKRYRMAWEFAHVVRGLWNSWTPETFVRNQKSGLFIDPEKLYVLEHEGEFFKVKGPLIVPPSPQGEPVMVQAGASEDGRELAAATAEVVFGAQQHLDTAREFYADVKGRMATYGRDPDSLKIMPGLTYFVAETREQAQAEFEELQDLIDPVMGLALLSQRMDFDFSGFNPDDPVPQVPVTPRGGSRAQLINQQIEKNPGITLRTLYKQFAGSRGHGLIIGSPADVADHMELWVTQHACDGFNMMPPLYPRDLQRFVDLVVPELQRRGLYRTAYEATTLRGNLGITRPPWSPKGVQKIQTAAC